MSVKESKSIFVIMPFTKTPKRNKEQLTAFFRDHLKPGIKGMRLKHKYNVARSNDVLNINEQIIIDIYNADIVICDLSGKESNPNVMYELGMRLALTNNPVILIREANENNYDIFDIAGFYIQIYDPLNYKPLLDHIEKKIKDFETEKVVYKSPVLKILKQDNPLLMQLSFTRANEKLLFMVFGLQRMLMIFSNHLARYLKNKKINFTLGKTRDDIIPNITKNLDKFGKIDLSEFHCSLSSQPMIDAYLAEQFLNNITTREIATLFTVQLISYHAHYFGMDLQHHMWTPVNIYKFYGESEILILIIKIICNSLGESEDVVQKATKDIKALIKKSNIFE